MAAHRLYKAPDGTHWGAEVSNPGASNALVTFHHPIGRTVEPSALVGAARSGRRVVITGDTRPCASTIEASRGADLLVHEATFADEELERAKETGHSTAREAAGVARDAGVRQLALTHFSARYSRDPSDLQREAREIFADVVLARDGMEISVPYASGE